MTYMSEGKTKKRGFYLPEGLNKAWDNFIWPNKQDSSPNAAAALFVYMQLPADMREKARKLAYRSDIEEATKAFIDDINAEYQDRLAREAVESALYDAAKQKQKPGRHSSKAG